MVGCGERLDVSMYEKLVCGKDKVGGKVWLCDDCINNNETMKELTGETDEEYNKRCDDCEDLTASAGEMKNQPLKCDKCGEAKESFFWDGEYMVCKSCRDKSLFCPDCHIKKDVCSCEEGNIRRGNKPRW
jgi:hypothetical protein